MYEQLIFWNYSVYQKKSSTFYILMTCFLDISAPKYQLRIVVYSKWAYGYKFSDDICPILVRLLVLKKSIKM